MNQSMKLPLKNGRSLDLTLCQSINNAAPEYMGNTIENVALGVHWVCGSQHPERQKWQLLVTDADVMYRYTRE